MALDLTKTLSWTHSLAALTPDTADELAMLNDLQGNILKGHGRHFTSQVFLSFCVAAEARQFISALAGEVTTALAQLVTARLHKATTHDGGPFVAFFLSSSGYDALGLAPLKPASHAFASGMKARAHSLADPLSAYWDAHLAADLHAMVLLAGATSADRDTAQSALEMRVAASAGAVKIIGFERGDALFNRDGQGIEHFGYVDGRSQPLPLAEDVDAEARIGGIDQWNPAVPLDQVIVRCPGGDRAVSCGSFFVFRKLEQNVRGFKQREIDLSDHLGGIGERAGASVIGRFENGTPVTLFANEVAATAPGSDGIANNFNYAADKDGLKCPFAGHIRKTNPRLGTRDSTHHLMLRRGIPYGRRADNPNDGRLDNKPVAGVGLLFMSYQSDIERQFEFTQRSWVNNADFPNAGTGVDSVIGQPPATSHQLFPGQWNASFGEPFDFSGFVNLRGGEYFFAPSISFLKSMVSR